VASKAGSGVEAGEPGGREEALTRLTGWERAFWEMLQERKAALSTKGEQACETPGAEPEPAGEESMG